MGNERGYILPFVLMICSLLFFILSNQITLYVTDIKFYREKEELLLLDRMLQKSIVDLKPLLTIEEEELRSGNFTYDEGIVSFTSVDEDLDHTKIVLSYQTNRKRKAVIYLYYNKNTRLIERWIEER